MSHADVLTEPMLGDASLIVKVFMTGVRKQLNKRTEARGSLRSRHRAHADTDVSGHVGQAHSALPPTVADSAN